MNFSGELRYFLLLACYNTAFHYNTILLFVFGSGSGVSEMGEEPSVSSVMASQSFIQELVCVRLSLGDGSEWWLKEIKIGR